jgi:opacity protein-like surface antigen
MFLPFNSTGISGLAEDTFSVRTTWDASLRGRIGFLPAPWLMAYATGGPAWLHVTATSTCNAVEAGRCAPGSFSPSVISDSTTKLGWTVGAGLEAQLRSNWIARAEYRYSDFGTITNTDVRQNGGGAAGPAAFDRDLRSRHQDTHDDPGRGVHVRLSGLLLKERRESTVRHARPFRSQHDVGPE